MTQFEDKGDQADEVDEHQDRGDAESGADRAADSAADAAPAAAGTAQSREPALPPVEPGDVQDLFAAYDRGAGGSTDRKPWSWSSLSAGDREALVALLDGFVLSYNAIWALTDAQTIPPCWHRHPALGHDLAALAWAHYEAYRDVDATATRALAFQAALPGFAERLDRWLGNEPSECRAGRHPSRWREMSEDVNEPTRTSTADSDAVMLLGAEQFGFPR